MKKPSLSFIILAIVLGALAFYEVKDTITGDKQFFLVRMMFWNPGYAKKIEIKPYLLTDEQVIQSLSHPEIELQQPTNKELSHHTVNVALRIKNDGGALAWGTLAYSIDNINWWKMDIILDPINSRNNVPFREFVTPIGRVVFYDDDELPEPIQVKWIALYTK